NGADANGTSATGVGSGEHATDEGDTGSVGEPRAASEPRTADEQPAPNPETRAVIEELTDVDLAETAPIELLSRVQEWQERLE
ncbi:hypothetical protein, partial [Halorubrum tibetense]